MKNLNQSAPLILILGHRKVPFLRRRCLAGLVQRGVRSSRRDEAHRGRDAPGSRMLTRWMAVLFAAGSLCFVVAPFPGFVQLVGAQADAAVFFAGSVLFTLAARLSRKRLAVRGGGGSGEGGGRRRPQSPPGDG